MRLKTLTLILCFATAFLLTGQLTHAQDITKILTPTGELTPEAQRTLRESQQFKTLTPEEIEQGKAELERMQTERRQEQIEKTEKREDLCWRSWRFPGFSAWSWNKICFYLWISCSKKYYRRYRLLQAD